MEAKVEATLVGRSGLQVVAKVEATVGGQRSGLQEWEGRGYNPPSLYINLFEILCSGFGILHLWGLDRRGTIVLRQGITLVLWSIYVKEVMRLAGS